MGVYAFYAPSRWCEATQTSKKIRLIINEVPRNYLFSPCIEHIKLPGHRLLQEAVSFCADGNYLSTFSATRIDIETFMDSERSKDQSKRATWSDFVPRRQSADPDPLSFMPCLGKADLSNAYYQLPVDRADLSKVLIPSIDDWVPRLSAVLTFGNRAAFQGWTEFLDRIANFYLGIPILGYLDDYIIFAPENSGGIYHRAIQRLFDLMGFSLTAKHDGNLGRNQTSKLAS